MVSKIFHFHHYLGKMNPFRRAYFSTGLKPPSRYVMLLEVLCSQNPTISFCLFLILRRRLKRCFFPDMVVRLPPIAPTNPTTATWICRITWRKTFQKPKNPPIFVGELEFQGEKTCCSTCPPSNLGKLFEVQLL